MKEQSKRYDFRVEKTIRGKVFATTSAQNYLLLRLINADKTQKRPQLSNDFKTIFQ